MTEFQQKVITIVSQIPQGKVVSYGQVALALNYPRGALMVGWTLRQLNPDLLPWWRVINGKGRISIKGNPYVDASEQKRLLEAEGIKVSDDLEINLESYRHYFS